MAKVKVVTGTTGTSSTTVDYTSSGFGTVDAAIVIATWANTTNNPEAGGGYSIGFTDGASEYSIQQYAQDATSTREARTFGGNNQGIAGILNGTSSADWYATSSLITDGIRLDYTSGGAPSVSCYLTIILFGEMTNAYVGQAALSGSGDHDITSPTFKPNLVFSLTRGRNITNDYAGHNNMHFGAVHNNSSDVVSEACINYWRNSLTDPTQAAIRLNTAGNHRYISGYDMNFTTFDSSGFTINTGATDPGGDYVYYLALDTGDTDGVDVSIIDTPTSTGSWAVTDPGFNPQCVILVEGFNTTVDTTVNSGSEMAIGITAFDGTTIRTVGDWSQDEVYTGSNEGTWSADSLSFESNAGVQYAGTLTSLDSSGYTLSMSSVSGTSHKWISIAISSGTNPAPIFSNHLNMLNNG